MLRHSFLKRLSELNQKVSDMGEKVESVIEETIEALKEIDVDKAKRIVEGDEEIDRIEHEIERACLDVIALQQPMARDLRMVAGCLKIITDIERIADQCADICEIVCMHKMPKNVGLLDEVLEILNKVKGIFQESLKVFKNRDVNNAVEICRSDEDIDSLFSNIVFHICGVIAKDISKLTPEIDLLFITKYAERMGDHCTNIAEWVIYMETGQRPELN